MSEWKFTKFGPENPVPVLASTVSLVHGPMSPKDLEKASLLTKAQRLRNELTVWAKAGLPLATGAVRKARIATCAACEYFNAKGNFGLGECRAPGCGCSRIKAALATSKCPKGKWNA